ncbi:MAG: hypothetical protein KGI27_00600 [Thaumarchaeota archaeon]|nr:hypothetical protein [Nitrososphaerota archaeon]
MKTTHLAIIAIVIISLAIVSFSSKPAYAVGCAVWGYGIGEGGATPFYNPQPHLVKGRNLDVGITILHDLFNYDYNGTTRSISFRLCDTNGDKNMSDTIYKITVTKEDGHKTVLNNVFYSGIGLLQLQIQNYSTTEIMPYVRQDPNHDNAFVADSNGTVYMKNPFLWEPGVYDLTVRILGFGTSNVFYQNGEPVFNYTADVPDTVWEEIQHGNSTYRIKVLSTQKIESFNYDADTMRLYWSVRVPQEQILNKTHQVFSDVEIPRSFHEFSESPFLNATINDASVRSSPMSASIPQSEMMVNLYSPLSLLSDIAKNANMTDAAVTFSLAPLLKSSTRLDLNHGVYALVTWSPSPPVANASETLHVKFLTASGAPLKNAVYDVYLSNRHGINFEHYDVRVAKDGTDSAEFLFPQDDIYKLYIHVRGVSNSSAPHSIDNALDGDAYGYVVVGPEFDTIATNTMTQHNMTFPYQRDLVTPLRQVKMGIQPQDVTCDWSGFQLVLKSEDGSPACASPHTAKILTERGWGYIPLRLR